MRKECINCGSKETVSYSGEYKFVECGLDNVVLKGIPIIDCPECGIQDPIIPNFEGLLGVIAAALVQKPCPLNGAEVRFLRKYGGWNAVEFGKMVGVDSTTISKWENGKQPVGKPADRLIRVTALVGEKMNRPPQLKQVMDHFQKIAPTCCPELLDVNPSTMSYQYLKMPA